MGLLSLCPFSSLYFEFRCSLCSLWNAAFSVIHLYSIQKTAPKLNVSIWLVHVSRLCDDNHVKSISMHSGLSCHIGFWWLWPVTFNFPTTLLIINLDVSEITKDASHQRWRWSCEDGGLQGPEEGAGGRRILGSGLQSNLSGWECGLLAWGKIQWRQQLQSPALPRLAETPDLLLHPGPQRPAPQDEGARGRGDRGEERPE